MLRTLLLSRPGLHARRPFTSRPFTSRPFVSRPFVSRPRVNRCLHPQTPLVTPPNVPV